MARVLADSPHLTIDLAVDLVLVAQFVPQPVDLVQHHQPALVRAVLGRANVVVPDLDVRFGHAGVGGQDEQHGMRRGQHAEGQFRLGAEGVQARRVQDHQPLIKQRVRQVDDGMTPFRNVDQTIVARPQADLGLVLGDVKAHRLRRFARDGARFDDVLERFDHRGRRFDVERLDLPFFRQGLVFGDGGAVLACLDRQQLQARFRIPVVQQLGWAHGGAPGAGRQDALAEIGEEDGVDQLGLAARELGDEGDVELVVAQGSHDVIEALFGLRVAEVLSVQPTAQLAHRVGDLAAP